jgi:GTP cyclohydrolase IA
MQDKEHWQVALKDAVALYLEQECRLPVEHSRDTPRRVASAFAEYASGYMENPIDVLSTSFEDTAGYRGMVHVQRIPLMSMCAHHILPIIGVADFAYIPNGRVVGLSKIPRFVDILSRRLQIQENLTVEIADTFMKAVSPKGCAITIRAFHFCMVARGVRIRDAMTETRELRGCFEAEATRLEYMSRLSQEPIL